MSDRRERPPRAPTGTGKVVSIVEQLARKRAKQERDRAAATHLRQIEATQEMAEHTAAIEEMDLDAAIVALEELPADEAREGRAQIRTLRGLRSCLRGDIEAGFAEWAETIAEAPEFASAYLFRARWKMRADPASALEDFDLAAEAEPTSATVYARRGDCYSALGDQDRALANYRRAVALDPTLFDVHRFMAGVFAARGEHAEARAAYDRAIHLAPRYVDFYLGRAETLEKLGDVVAAVRDYDRVLELDPSRDDARSRRAVCLARSGDVHAAIAEMARLANGDLSDAPGAHEAFTLLGGIRLAVGQRAEAIEDFSRAIEREPDDVSARAQRGRAYWDSGEYQRALDDLDRAVALAPGEPEHHVSRANALAKLERMQEAVDSLTRAIELAPEHAAAFALRAIYGSHVQEGDVGLALVKADLARAIEIAPDNVTYLRKRGEFLMELGEFSAALPDIEKALSLAPGEAKLHYDRGFCNSRLDEEWFDQEPDPPETPEQEQARYASALVDLEKAIELGQHDEDVHFELVRVRESMGDPAGMLAELDRAIAAIPDFTVLLALRYDRRRHAGDVEGAADDRARLIALGFPVDKV